MNRKNWYWGQKVKEAELDEAFDDVDNAIKSFLEGFAYVGIALGAVVTENAVPNLTVDVSGPAIIWDQMGRHIAWSPTQDVVCSIDEDGNATAVAVGGNEKWLSIFAEFVATESDPRVDKGGDPLFYRLDEGFEIHVVQGGEALIGAAVRPPLRGDQILLADVRLEQGQTTILNADVSASRAEVTFALTGTPLAIRERGLQAVLQQMLDQLNAFGVTTIESPLITDAPLSLDAGTVLEQTTQLLAHVNDVAAHQNRANTFTETQAVDADEADEPLLTTTKVATDHPAQPTNTWKLELAFPTGDGARMVRLYVGADVASLGHMALTVNAVWSPGGLTWSSDADADGSIRLVANVFATGCFLRVQHKEPTGASWADGSWASAPASNDGYGNVQASGRYKFANGGRGRDVALNLIDCVPSFHNGNPQWSFLPANGYWSSLAADAGQEFLMCPVKVARGETLDAVDVIVDEAAAAVIACSLLRITGIDWDAVTVPAPTVLATVNSVGDGSQNKVTINVAELDVDTEDTTYWLAIRGGTAGDKVKAIRLSFVDFGPTREHP